MNSGTVHPHPAPGKGWPVARHGDRGRRRGAASGRAVRDRSFERRWPREESSTVVRATVAPVERNQGRSHPPRVRSRGRAVSSGAAIAGILATIRGRARPSSRPAAAGRPAVAGRRTRMAHPVVSRRGYGEAVASGLPGGQSEVTLGRLAARAGGCVPGFAGPVLVAGNEGDLTFFVVAGEVDLPRSTPGAGAGAEVAIARGRASFLPPEVAEALPPAATERSSSSGSAPRPSTRPSRRSPTPATTAPRLPPRAAG